MSFQPIHIPPIMLDTSPVYEFINSIHVFSASRFERKYDISPQWFDEVEVKASPELLASIEIFPQKCSHGLIELAYDCPTPKDIPAFLDYLATIDPWELRLHMVGYYTRGLHHSIPADLIQQAIRGDNEAQRQFARMSNPDEPRLQKALLSFLANEPDDIKQHLLTMTNCWYEEIFRDMESEITPILLRDVEAKRALQQTVPPERFIELATNGYEYIPEPFIREIILTPTYFGRPYIHISEYRDIRIFAYPVADENITTDTKAPPARFIRLYKALGDERRLRILKEVSTGSYGIQELADSLGVGKTTLHHHMVILRSAGLIRLRSSDKRYSLREGTIPSDLLAAYLKKEM